jgi:hypothetical protein
MALFEYSKKKMANEDYGDEGKNYVMVINSNNRVYGNNNTAQYNVDYSFLPKNYQYFQMTYSLQTAGGVFKDSIIECGCTTSGALLTIQTYDSTVSGQNCAIGARVIPLVASSYLSANTYIKSYASGTGLLGTYSLNQAPSTDFASKLPTGTISDGSNTVTFAISQTGLLGMFITHPGTLSLSPGTRIVGGAGTTWYMSKPALGNHTTQTMTLYPPFQIKINYSSANLHMDFGCKSYIYDNANNGSSSFLGVSQRYNQQTYGSNHFKMWWEELPSQILNIHNSSGTITTTIYNGDDQAYGGNQLMTDTSLQGIPTEDFVPYILTISLKPILSSHIDTQSF